jgi:hypothetical protein
MKTNKGKIKWIKLGQLPNRAVDSTVAEMLSEVTAATQSKITLLDDLEVTAPIVVYNYPLHLLIEGKKYIVVLDELDHVLIAPMNDSVPKRRKLK